MPGHCSIQAKSTKTLSSVVLRKQPRVIRSDYHRDVAPVRQHQGLEDGARMVHLLVEDHSQNRRTLKLTVHKHIDRRRARAVWVDAVCAGDILYSRASRHATCLTADLVACGIGSEVANRWGR